MMHWQEMSDVARAVLVHERVMGKSAECACACVYLAQGAYHCATCLREFEMREVKYPLNHPHQVPARKIPHYSTSMEAAWQVLQALKEREKRLLEQEKYVISRAFLSEQEKYDISGAFMEALQTHTHDSWGLPVLSFWSLACLTPERICYAACRAIGVLDEAGNVQDRRGQE